MTEQEMMQEALKWQEHIARLASQAMDNSDRELYVKRSKTLDWLIQQAEQVEKLVQENDDLRFLNNEFKGVICDLKSENQRLREALNTIAWSIEATNPQSMVMKSIARKVL